MVDQRHFRFERDKQEVIENIWRIGGKNGWYYATILWNLRGLMDLLLGGKGHGGQRRDPFLIQPGDRIDSWLVVETEKSRGYLLLMSMMKLPGKAWLAFKVEDDFLIQTVKFEPLGFIGRLYWHLVSPLHNHIFDGMGKNIVKAPCNK